MKEQLAVYTEYLYIYSKCITHRHLCRCNMMSISYWLEEGKLLTLIPIITFSKLLILISYSEIHNYPSLVDKRTVIKYADAVTRDVWRAEGVRSPP